MLRGRAARPPCRYNPRRANERRCTGGRLDKIVPPRTGRWGSRLTRGAPSREGFGPPWGVARRPGKATGGGGRAGVTGPGGNVGINTPPREPPPTRGVSITGGNAAARPSPTAVEGRSGGGVGRRSGGGAAMTKPTRGAPWCWRKLPPTCGGGSGRRAEWMGATCGGIIRA